MRLSIVAATLLLLIAGCGYTPAAKSTLTLSQANESAGGQKPVGFADAVYDDPNGRIVIVGHGWMPHEDQGRVWTWNSQFQPVRSRWFRMVSEPPVDDGRRVWNIELVVDPMLPVTGHACDTLVRNDIYTASFHAGHSFKDGLLTLELADVRLTNIENKARTLQVSGHVTAARASSCELAEMREGFELAKDYH